MVQLVLGYRSQVCCLLIWQTVQLSRLLLAKAGRDAEIKATREGQALNPRGLAAADAVQQTCTPVNKF